MRILFRFGDNDFGTTFREVFQVLLRATENPRTRDKMRDKEFICAFINELAFPMYRTMQCWDFPDRKDRERFKTDEEYRDFYTSYFHATPDMIYIDKEIDELLSVYGDGNMAWFVLNTEEHYPEWRVYAV